MLQNTEQDAIPLLKESASFSKTSLTHSTTPHVMEYGEPGNLPAPTLLHNFFLAHSSRFVLSCFPSSPLFSNHTLSTVRQETANSIPLYRFLSRARYLAEPMMCVYQRHLSSAFHILNNGIYHQPEDIFWSHHKFSFPQYSPPINILPKHSWTLFPLPHVPPPVSIRDITICSWDFCNAQFRLPGSSFIYLSH